MSRTLISRVIQQSAAVSAEAASRAADDVMAAISEEIRTAGQFALPDGAVTVRKAKGYGSNPGSGTSGYRAGPVRKPAARPAAAGQVRSDIVRTVTAILGRWEIPENIGLAILGSPAATLDAVVRLGDTSLSTRDRQDRARLLFDIHEGVYGLLKDPSAERQWIRTPRDEMEGRSVLDLMAEGSQRNLIRALAYVDYVNGR